MSNETKPPNGGNTSLLPKPKFRFSANIMASAVILAPVAGYVWYTNRHEKIEKQLQQSTQYASQMRQSESKKKEIVNIIRSTPDGNKQSDERLEEVLHAGKVNATTKRKSYIDMDNAAYGDDEAVRKSQEFQKSIKEARETKLEATKNRRKGIEPMIDSTGKSSGDGSTYADRNLMKGATIATVGIALAATAVAFVGVISGSSRQK